MKRGPLLLGLSVIVSCCGDDSRGRVTSAEFGNAWPFTVPDGILRCDVDGAKRYVTLDTGKGIYYALNGSAKSFGYPDSKDIQKPGTVGVDLQPFIARGLALCR